MKTGGDHNLYLALFGPLILATLLMPLIGLIRRFFFSQP
jgi:hypothetical protein